MVIGNDFSDMGIPLSFSVATMSLIGTPDSMAFSMETMLAFILALRDMFFPLAVRESNADAKALGWVFWCITVEKVLHACGDYVA